MRVIYRLDTIKERLRPIFESYPINKAVLFGSYAKGVATPESDLDIILSCDSSMRGIQFYAVKGKIERTLQKDVDVFAESDLRKGTPIYDNIMKEGVSIYERNR